MSIGPSPFKSHSLLYLNSLPLADGEAHVRRSSLVSGSGIDRRPARGRLVLLFAGGQWFLHSSDRWTGDLLCDQVSATIGNRSAAKDHRGNHTRNVLDCSTTRDLDGDVRLGCERLL